MTIGERAEKQRQEPTCDVAVESEPEQPQPSALPSARTQATAYAVAAGSARVARFVLARQPGPVALTPAQITEAIDWTNARYDELSIGIIQHIVGVPATHTFDDATAQAVATFQNTNHLLVDGKVGHQTLTSAFPGVLGADGAHDQLIHLVSDLENLDITTETSAVRFDRTQATRGAAEFEPSGLRVVKLGTTAFASSRILRDTIRAQLRAAAPAAAAPGAAPTVLDPLSAAAALLVNSATMSNPHSPRAVSGLVGGARENVWSLDLVQRLAAFQQANGQTGDGLFSVATLELLVSQLTASGDNTGAVVLIVDFFNFQDDANLVAIFFDPNVTANASTGPFNSADPNQPVSVRVGPAGMAQPFASLVHTIEHEFAHVRLLRAGEGNRETQEFLGEATEILSTTPQEDIDGFMDDADRGEANWVLMPADRQITHRDRFIAARQVVRDRHAAATPAEQVRHQGVLDRWNAVVLPAGPPAAGP